MAVVAGTRPGQVQEPGTPPLSPSWECLGHLALLSLADQVCSAALPSLEVTSAFTRPHRSGQSDQEVR